MIALLLALLLTQFEPSLPVIDEGDRWECATLIATHDNFGRNECRLVFWRRDLFGNLAAGEDLYWGQITLWNVDETGIRFHWHDDAEECFRTLLVPRWDWIVVDLDRWRVSWPESNLEGFLPNPEKQAPQ